MGRIRKIKVICFLALLLLSLYLLDHRVSQIFRSNGYSYRNKTQRTQESTTLSSFHAEHSFPVTEKKRSTNYMSVGSLEKIQTEMEVLNEENKTFVGEFKMHVVYLL